MALGANTVWEVETGGSDTNGSGAFDPGQTAGMFTDGAATSANTTAPVFTSASYNFVAGDVNAWVFIASGTNWTPGWYKISSVAANAATLDGTIGNGVTKAGTSPPAPTTLVGCATVASPTAATWSIDYSQQASSQFTYTDISSTGIGLTASSAAHPFGKQQVGNSIVVTGGTNFNIGRYVLASVSGVTGTFVGPGNLHSAAGTDSDGAGRMGGALASPGQAGAVMVASNTLWIKSGTYTITSATANTAGGTFGPNVDGLTVIGYQTVRADYGTAPLLQASGIATFTIFNSQTGSFSWFGANITADCAGLTGGKGFNTQGGVFYLCRAKNCKSGAFTSNNALFVKCTATGCSTTTCFTGGSFIACEAFSNTISAFSLSVVQMAAFCIAYNNTGSATVHGFLTAGSDALCINCVAYGNQGDGFHFTSSRSGLVNCIAENNTTTGILINVASMLLVNCAVFNNGTNVNLTSALRVLQLGLVTCTAEIFTNAAGNDFSLNTTGGGGAACRAAGIPGTFADATTTGFIDIGAVQHADPAAGTGLAILAGMGLGLVNT